MHACVRPRTIARGSDGPSPASPAARAARSHWLCVSGLAGLSEDHSYVVEGSALAVAERASSMELSYRRVSLRGIPATVPGSRLRATEHLDPAERQRASVRFQTGNDLLLRADGTLKRIDRELPDPGERATGIP